MSTNVMPETMETKWMKKGCSRLLFTGDLMFLCMLDKW